MNRFLGHCNLRKYGIALSALVFLVTTPIFAFDMRADKSVLVTTETPAIGNVYLVGMDAKISSPIPNDALVLANIFENTASIGSDLLVLAGKASIFEKVAQDARVIAFESVFNSHIGGELLAVGEKVHITAEAVIHGDVHIIAEHVIIDGTVQGKLSVTARVLEMRGKAENGVEANISYGVTLFDSATIVGPFIYTAPREAVISQKATIDTAQVTFTKRDPHNGMESASSALTGVVTIFNMLRFIGLFIGAILLSWLFPRFTLRTITFALNNGATSVVRGLVAVFGGLLVSIAMMASLILALPAVLMFYVGAAFIILSYFLTGIFAGVLLHQWIKGGVHVSLLWSAFGVIVLMLISAVPVVGTIARLILFFAMAGALFEVTRESWWNNRALKKEEVVSTPSEKEVAQNILP